MTSWRRKPAYNLYRTDITPKGRWQSGVQSPDSLGMNAQKANNIGSGHDSVDSREVKMFGNKSKIASSKFFKSETDPKSGPHAERTFILFC